jgi:hypothetical protein
MLEMELVLPVELAVMLVLMELLVTLVLMLPLMLEMELVLTVELTVLLVLLLTLVPLALLECIMLEMELVLPVELTVVIALLLQLLVALHALIMDSWLQLENLVLIAHLTASNALIPQLVLLVLKDLSLMTMMNVLLAQSIVPCALMPTLALHA